MDKPLMDEADPYDEWNLTLLPMPPRNPLYAPSPIGMGTPLVESLTSYITRLAEAHCMFSGILVSKMIAPLVPGYSPLQKQHGLFSDSGGRSNLFNGIGLPALYAVQALESLTLRTDLHYLTCLPLTAILPSKARGLLRLTKAWCRECYEQWCTEGRVLYDPLLWAFQAITHCPFHRQRLSTHCPYQDCARALPGVGWRARVGYCSYCQRWLGVLSKSPHHDASSQTEKEWLWQQWVIQTVGEVLAFLPTNSMPLERNRIQQVVVHALHHLTAGNFSAFTRALGIQLATVHQWHQGKALPELAMLLQLCYRLGLSLHQVLFQELESLQPHFNTSFLLEPLAPRKQVVADEGTIYQALEKVLADDEQPPPSLRQIGRRLGHSDQTLYRSHPIACREIVQRYKTYVQHQKETRLQRFQEEIRHVALQLLTSGMSLTQKHIALHLSHPGILRNPQVRQYLREICQEVEAKG